jgi:gas vesicle protein
MSARFRVLAALLAVLAFLPAGPADAAPPDLSDQIAAAWRTDRIFVDPGLRPGFPKTELDRIRAASAAAGIPVSVALLPRTPAVRKISFEMPTLLQARVGQPGLYVVWTVSDTYWGGSEELFRPAGLRGRSLTSVQLDDKQDNKLVTDRPAPKIVRTIQQAATAYDGRALPPIPASDLQQPYTPRRGLSTTDKEDRSAFTGMGIGGVIGFLLVLILALRSRGKAARSTSKATPGRPRGISAKQSLPASEITLRSVSSQATRWISKADRTLKNLEKRRELTRLQLDQRDDARLRLDAARTLRKAEPDDLLAAAGALVLARQAHQVASNDDLLRPCFFDPTHPSGTSTAAWSDDTEVPACRTCAQTVSRGETPHGFRVTPKPGLLSGARAAEPYWTLDPENPMVATGFGALSDDLADRVERIYGGVR